MDDKKKRERVKGNCGKIKEDMKDSLSEYFSTGVNEDEELAQALGCALEDIRRLREEYEG